MADIDLERKEGTTWWPWVLGLALVALVIWGASEAMDVDPEYEAAELAEQTDVPVEPAARASTPGTVDERDASRTAGASLSEIRANPSAWIGRAFPDGEVTVESVPTDRGFWIEEGDARLFALLVDDPVEEPVDINPGQTLRIEGGTLRAPSYLSEVAGESVDDDSRRIAEGLDIMIVVDESGLDIVETAGSDM